MKGESRYLHMKKTKSPCCQHPWSDGLAKGCSLNRKEATNNNVELQKERKDVGSKNMGNYDDFPSALEFPILRLMVEAKT